MEAEAAAGQAEAADSTTAFCNFVRIKIAFFVSLQKKQQKKVPKAEAESRSSKN